MAEPSATIELYTWKTPNGRKISIALEELGLPYAAHAVDLGARAQFDPDFVKVSPAGKIPALVDPDGPDGAPISLFESGAILIYLAEKTGRFLPSAARPRLEVLQWLMWQMGNFGPMLGQAHHFRRFAKETVPYAIERYTREAGRLYNVLDRHLSEAEFLAGGAYSIADIATYPWVARHSWHGVELNDYPNVKRWYGMLGARPAVAKGMVVPMPE
jgi:GST-like protein